MDEIGYHLLLAAVTAFAIVVTILLSVALWDWWRDHLSKRK